jgi:uncharacterized membrane-anchored protein
MPAVPTGRWLLRPGLAVLAVLVSLVVAHAQLGVNTPEQRDRLSLALDNAIRGAVGGPIRVLLAGGRGTLQIPEEMAFVDTAGAAELIAALNVTDPSDIVGVIFKPGSVNGVAVIRYVPAGHVRAEDIRRWTAADILLSIKETVEAANPGRVRDGAEPLEVRDWVVEPAYDPRRHSMFWSPLIVTRDTPPNTGSFTIYSVAVLGREGYFLIQYASTMYRLDIARADIGDILNGLGFPPGHGYDDFQAGTDTPADHGVERMFGVSRLQAVPITTTQQGENIAVVQIAGGGLVVGALLIGLGLLIKRYIRNRPRRGYQRPVRVPNHYRSRRRRRTSREGRIDVQ